jgi:hypothetical protein
MPRVPTVEAPRVQQSPLRGGENQTRAINTHAGATTSALGTAITGFSDVGARIQERRDLDEAFRVETQVLSDYSAFEQNLRKTRRGANAQGVVDDVDQWWSKIDDTYGANVSPRVKALTAKSLARARLQAMESTGRYQMAEEDRAQTESFTAVNGQEIQRAITAGAPEALASAKGKISAAVTAFGATRGWTPEQVAAEQQKWVSTLHVQALGSMVDADPKGAKAYFEANRADIASENHARLSKMIDRGVAEANATESAAKWASLPFEQAIENANKINDPDERKLTIAAVRDLQADKNTAIQLREREASDKVWQLIASGVSSRQLPRAALEQMNGRERIQVNAYYEAEQKRRAAEAKGESVKTDPAVYGAVLDKLREDPQGTRPETFAGLSRGDIRSLQNHRDALLGRAAGGASKEDEKEVATTTQQTAAYIAQMGLRGEAKGAFQKAVLDELDLFKRANNRSASYEERTKILDRLSMERARGMFKFNDRLFQVPRAERSAFVNDVVPAADRAQIVAALKKNKQPVTVQNVLDMYIAGKK